VHSGTLSKAEEEKAKSGTKSSVGADFTCVLTDTPIKTAYIKGEGREGRMGARLMAIVAEGERGRVYLPPTADHERIAESPAPAWEPEGELFTGALGFRVPAYGFREWRQLYTRRQLVALTTFTDLVGWAKRTSRRSPTPARRVAPPVPAWPTAASAPRLTPMRWRPIWGLLLAGLRIVTPH
jgi:putative DNA methylase